MRRVLQPLPVSLELLKIPKILTVFQPRETKIEGRSKIVKMSILSFFDPPEADLKNIFGGLQFQRPSSNLSILVPFRFSKNGS